MEDNDLQSLAQDNRPIKSIGEGQVLIRFLWLRGLINNPIEKRVTLLGHILLTGGLITFTILAYFIMSFAAERLQNKWLKCENEIITQEIVIPNTSLAGKAKLETRLQQQLNSINQLVERHCYIMTFFYKHYSIGLSLGICAGAIFLFTTLFISKEGWKQTNNALINIWATTFVITIFYLNIAQTFQQQENLKASQDLYASYLTLRNRFLTAIAIGEPSKKKDELLFWNELITTTDSQLSQLSFISLGFDRSPIRGIVGGEDASPAKSPAVSPK